MQLDPMVMYYFQDELEKQALARFNSARKLVGVRKPLLVPAAANAATTTARAATTAAKVTTDMHNIAPEIAQMAAAKGGGLRGWLQGAAHGINRGMNSIAGQAASAIM